MDRVFVIDLSVYFAGRFHGLIFQEEDEKEEEGVAAEIDQNGTENGKTEAVIPDEDSQPAAKRAKLDTEDSNGVPDSAAVES